MRPTCHVAQVYGARVLPPFEVNERGEMVPCAAGIPRLTMVVERARETLFEYLNGTRPHGRFHKHVPAAAIFQAMFTR